MQTLDTTLNDTSIIMRKLFYTFSIFLIVSNYSTGQEKSRQANINTIFEKMELQGVDTKRPLLFGYFFYDKDKSKLEKLKDELLKDNYRLVSLEKVDKNKYILHLEKIEIHTRESLLRRENWLDELAKKYKVELYDGWDVGNADPTKPLVSDSQAEASLKEKPDKELFDLAISLYNSDSYANAIIAFENCIKRNYKLDTSYYKLGICYINVGEVNLGIEKLEMSLKINPNYFKASFNIGATCYDNQQYEKSIRFYQIAAKLNPKDDNVFYGIAASQFVLEKFKESETNCQKALDLNPNNENARNLLARIKK